MLTADGNTLLTSKPDVLSRWKDYYATLLSRPAEIVDQILESIQQCPIRDELDEFPTKQEIEQAIASTANNKTAGLDGTPAEVYKHGGDTLVANLLDRNRRHWESGELPQDFKDALIVNIYKHKEDPKDCGNCDGILLLATTSKIFANKCCSSECWSLQMMSFQKHSANVAHHAARSTFTLRQLQEMAAEQSKLLYIAFVDFSIAFDSIRRPCLWRLLSKCGCPDKFILMLRAFYEVMQAQVMIDGEMTDAFPVAHGVKQGCVLASTLLLSSWLQCSKFQIVTPPKALTQRHAPTEGFSMCPATDLCYFNHYAYIVYAVERIFRKYTSMIRLETS